MDIGDIRALEDEQDPKRREALLKRLADMLDLPDVRALVQYVVPRIRPWDLIKNHNDGLKEADELKAACAACGDVSADLLFWEVQESDGGRFSDVHSTYYAVCQKCNTPHLYVGDTW